MYQNQLRGDLGRLSKADRRNMQNHVLPWFQHYNVNEINIIHVGVDDIKIVFSVPQKGGLTAMFLDLESKRIKVVHESNGFKLKFSDGAYLHFVQKI